MADTEKITINMNVVDLGQIDLLIEQGFYSNRTDFIKTAIRNQISNHSFELKETITRKSFCLGIISIDKKYLQAELEKNNTLDIKTIGMLILQDDITPDLALKTINSIKVFGSFRANENLKKILQDRIVS